MKMNKFCKLTLCLMFVLSSCEKDPIFQNEDARVDVVSYVGNVNLYSADLYCQVETDVSIKKVVLQYSVYSTMVSATEVIMDTTKSYPAVGSFSNKNLVYHCHLDELHDSTTYYCRIMIESPIGFSIGDELQITTKSLTESAVSTNEAIDVSLTSATLSGYVVKDEGIQVSERGFYYSNNEKFDNNIKIISGKGSGSFSSTIEDLTPNVIYYFVAYAIINEKECRGNIKNFTTTSFTLAEVSTGDAKDINYNKATCSFVISNKGNSGVLDAGIIYGRTQELDVNNAEIAPCLSSSYAENTSYDSYLDNLDAGVLYYYRAYATNNAGTTYGDVKTFSTKQMGTVLITTGKVEPSYESATIYYSLQSNGNDIKEYGIIYDDANSYLYDLDYNDGHFIKKVSISSSLKGQDINYVNYSFYIRDLVNDTPYGYCAYVKYIDEMGNENISYGEIKTFSTDAYEVPSVTTNEAKNITSTSVILYMSVKYYIINTSQRGFYISSDPDAPYYTDFDNYYDFSWLWRTEIVGTSSGLSKTVTGLTPNTTYYYVAWATNRGGNGYGEVMSFTTLEQ